MLLGLYHIPAVNPLTILWVPVPATQALHQEQVEEPALLTLRTRIFHAPTLMVLAMSLSHFALYPEQCPP